RVMKVITNPTLEMEVTLNNLPLIPAFQRFLSSHCPSSIPLFIMASYIPSYHALVLLPLFLLP
ncbi:hypothetical protein L9F63_018576, partial [Diploptera punctata]